VFARDLTTASGIEASDTTGAGTLGGFDGTSSPGNVAMAVSFRTGHAGRSYRGRNYISGIPVADVEGNGISPYWAAAIVAAFEGFITEAVSSGFAWVVVSTIAEGVLRELGVASPVIAAAVTDLAIDSMRRRLSGRGS